MENRELLQKYIDILKNQARYTGKEISALSDECGFKFSESTLVKATKKKVKTNEYYNIPVSTLGGIKEVLEKILKFEGSRNQIVQEKIEENSFNLASIPFINLSKNLPDKGHILISWEESQSLEVNSEKVFGITPTLNWTRSQIDILIKSAKEKGDCYFYILTEHRGLTNKVIIEKRAADAGVSDKIQIKELYSLPEFSKYNGITVPIPYDIAIYVNTYFAGDFDNKRTIAVTSIVIVNPQTVTTKNDLEHQDVVIDKQRTEELLYWAESTWERLNNTK